MAPTNDNRKHNPPIPRMIDSEADICRLPPGAGRARLVVCETSGRWAVALRRELASAVRILETRSVDHCWQALADAPASAAIVELTGANADTLLGRMLRLGRDLPLCRVAVVADRKLAGYQSLMREAGAVDFVASPRRLGPLANLACRHLDRAPEHQQGLLRQIWSNLPWSTD